MSGVALDILPFLLLQQIVCALAFFLLALVAIRMLAARLKNDHTRRPIRVPVVVQRAVRPLPETDSIRPRNTGFGTRLNPRAPPVLPSPLPDDSIDRPVT